MAPTFSKLAEADQLYEGNFEDWRKRISSIFMVKRRPRQLSATRLYDPTIGGTIDAPSGPDELETVRRRISPALLARLPQDMWSPPPSLGALFTQLMKFCGPFRLLDLPAELRVRIYEDVVDEAKIAESNDNKPCTITSSHRLPALANASQQLRHEVLPIYFSTATFTFNMSTNMNTFEEYSSKDYCRTLQAIALRWSRYFVRNSARHLRHLTLNLTATTRIVGQCVQWPRITLELLFSKSDGYRVEYPDTLSGRSKQILENHVRAVDGERKELGMSGETILVALVEEYDVWDYAKL